MGTRDSYNEIFLNTNRTNLTNILFCTRISRSLFAAGRSRGGLNTRFDEGVQTHVCLYQ